MIPEQLLARIRFQFAQLRRAPEWQIVRQVCTATATEEKPDWGPVSSMLREELGHILQQEIDAAKERAGK